MKHIINRRTPGHVTRLVWKRENSILRHEYILICVNHPSESEVSWIRLERMGNLHNKATGSVEEPAMLTFIAASSMQNLCHVDDRTNHDVTLDFSSLTLLKLAKIISIIHEEALNYTFLHHNCWWFAKQTVGIIVVHFKSKGAEQKMILKRCTMKPLKHGAAPYHSYHTATFVIIPRLFHLCLLFPAMLPIILALSQMQRTSQRIEHRVWRCLQE